MYSGARNVKKHGRILFSKPCFCRMVNHKEVVRGIHVTVPGKVDQNSSLHPDAGIQR